MKHLLTLAALVFATSCFGQVPDYVPADGLVAWWNMNGNGEDSGPFQINPVNNGYFSGADRFGNATGAFYSNETHINYGMHPEIQNESFSFAAWINPPSSTGSHKTIMGYHNDGDGGATLGLVEDNRVKLHTNNWDYEGLASSEPLNAYTWTHLVGTYSQGVLSLYIDGQLDIELEGIESPNSNGENFEVGRYFNGLIDEVGVWSRRLDVDEILGLYNSTPLVFGCTDSSACNFSSEANHDDGSCIDCALFEEKCGPGTTWDDSVQLCLVANPSDTDFDGCVGMTDLLDLLSLFGTCNEIPWSCGGLLNYQGYNYETVQIGAQCWFAENLRSENYENGDVIPAELGDDEWFSLTSGASTVYGEGEGLCATHSPIGDDCNAAWSLNEYGYLYNWFAVEDSRNLCPSGWHVPSDEDWIILEITLGMSESEVYATGQRGWDQGHQLKSTIGWGFLGSSSGNGSNSSGFSARPGGLRTYNSATLNGSFYDAGQAGFWWSSTAGQPNQYQPHYAWFRSLNHGLGTMNRQLTNNVEYGLSVRCIKDSE